VVPQQGWQAEAITPSEDVLPLIVPQRVLEAACATPTRCDEQLVKHLKRRPQPVSFAVHHVLSPWVRRLVKDSAVVQAHDKGSILHAALLYNVRDVDGVCGRSRQLLVSKGQKSFA